jgi:hypothetical protein
MNQSHILSVRPHLHCDCHLQTILWNQMTITMPLYIALHSKCRGAEGFKQRSMQNRSLKVAVQGQAAIPTPYVCTYMSAKYKIGYITHLSLFTTSFRSLRYHHVFDSFTYTSTDLLVCLHQTVFTYWNTVSFFSNM